jgi:hypothetical protein
MALASRIAEEDRNPSALYGAEKAIAEVRGIIIKNQPNQNQLDYNTCQSMQEIGCKLLQSVGFSQPDDVSIQQALELNNVFVAGLERIRDDAERKLIEQR